MGSSEIKKLINEATRIVTYYSDNWKEIRQGDNPKSNPIIQFFFDIEFSPGYIIYIPRKYDFDIASITDKKTLISIISKAEKVKVYYDMKWEYLKIGSVFDCIMWRLYNVMVNAPGAIIYIPKNDAELKKRMQRIPAMSSKNMFSS
ncbi:hypothetical protein LCGC14_0764680 [marine sediment metagenome]|uniref:Uncharacterized protein n=1 Tax=marine sediment metagenome TaxID=412755 RepID=A0A0F9Q0C1_9ZZZZ